MNDDRIRQLEELGFVWALRSGPDSSWRKKISELEDFRAHHGHCSVPMLYRGNVRLGEWAASIREAYRLRQQEGKLQHLEDDKVAELDTLGFNWEEPSPEVAEATNNEVTTVVADVDPAMAADAGMDLASGDGTVPMPYSEVQGTVSLAHTGVEGVSLMDHSPPAGPDPVDVTEAGSAAADHILQEAIEHAEI
mmetsp:Transcript_780/g.1853  ORF Transcript_780/g.1853 Transcript_780/m.1853 type:complete len:193 (-) Transcript_780:62-640(-)